MLHDHKVVYINQKELRGRQRRQDIAFFLYALTFCLTVLAICFQILTTAIHH